MATDDKNGMISAVVSRILRLAGRDIHMKEVVRGASVFISLRASGAGLSFIFNLALARLLGAEGSGIFYLALTVTTVASTIGSMGLGPALLRFTASNASSGEWEKVAGVYRIGMWVAAMASVAATAAVFIGAPWIAALFTEPALAAPLRVMSLGILPLAMINLHSELLRGLKRMRDSVIVMAVGVPAVSLAVLAAVRASFGVMGAAAAYTAAAAAVMALGFILWRMATPAMRGVHGAFDRGVLLGASLPLFWVSIITVLNSAVGAMALGIWSDSGEVGIFSIAYRTAMLTTFILMAVNGIAAPKFAELHSRGDMRALNLLARDTAKLVALAAAPIQALFILIPGWIMGVFGPEFADGAPSLVILSIGQFINVTTGSVGYLLIMSGNEKVLRNNMVAFAIVNIALAAALAPSMGATGASIASAVSIAGTHITSTILVYRRLAIITIPVPDRFLRG